MFEMADSGGLFALNIGTSISQTHGWQVEFNQASRVTHLGVYDAGLVADSVDVFGNPIITAGIPGLSVEIQLGVWNSSGQLLSTITLEAGDSALLTGLYWFAEISPIDVQAGEQLFFGPFLDLGIYLGGQTDYESFPILFTNHPGFALDSGLSYIGQRTVMSDGLAFPGEFDTFGFPSGAGSVNFMYETIPAPATTGVFGIVAMACVRRRRMS